MRANKTTIAMALETAVSARYPVGSKRRLQKEDEWNTQQKAIIKTLRGMLK